MVMLLRCTTIPYEWASVCNLFIPSSSATDSPGHDAREATTLPGVRCNWSVPVPTNILGVHTRAHAGSRPWDPGPREQFSEVQEIPFRRIQCTQYSLGAR